MNTFLQTREFQIQNIEYESGKNDSTSNVNANSEDLG